MQKTIQVADKPTLDLVNTNIQAVKDSISNQGTKIDGITAAKHAIWLNDFKTYGKNSFVYNNKEIFSELLNGKVAPYDGYMYTYLYDFLCNGDRTKLSALEAYAYGGKSYYYKVSPSGSKTLLGSNITNSITLKETGKVYLVENMSVSKQSSYSTTYYDASFKSFSNDSLGTSNLLDMGTSSSSPYVRTFDYMKNYHSMKNICRLTDSLNAYVSYALENMNMRMCIFFIEIDVS